MEFNINKNDLVEPALLASNVSEKRQSIPILSNVLISAAKNSIKITATDLEIEYKTTIMMTTTLTDPGKCGERPGQIHIWSSTRDMSQIHLSPQGPAGEIQHYEVRCIQSLPLRSSQLTCMEV